MIQKLKLCATKIRIERIVIRIWSSNTNIQYASRGQVTIIFIHAGIGIFNSSIGWYDKKDKKLVRIMQETEKKGL